MFYFPFLSADYKCKPNASWLIALVIILKCFILVTGSLSKFEVMTFNLVLEFFRPAWVINYMKRRKRKTGRHPKFLVLQLCYLKNLYKVLSFNQKWLWFVISCL